MMISWDAHIIIFAVNSVLPMKSYKDAGIFLYVATVL